MLTRTPLLLEMDLAQQRGDERGKRRKRRSQKAKKKTRLLFHIAKKPAKPHPAHAGHARTSGRKGGKADETPEGNWIRAGRKPAKAGAFLTPDPMRVAATHGVARNHVYAYRVPEGVLKKSGGVRNFDKAPEVLVPKKHWPDVKLVGKSETGQAFLKRDEREKPVILGNPFRDITSKSKKQKKRDKKAQDIRQRQQGRERQQACVALARKPLLIEALRNQVQSSKERMAKSRASSTFGAKRAAKWLWQQERKKWSKKHPQYIFRKGKLIFVAPEKRRQLKSKIKGRRVSRAKFPGSGKHG